MFGVATTVTFLVEPGDDGTQVTMDADVRGRGLSVLLAPVITREMRKSAVTALADLQRLLTDAPAGV